MATTLTKLDSAKREEAFALVSSVFVEQSTLHRACGIELNAYRDALYPEFSAMVAEGLSVVATDERTGAVVGSIIASDFFRHLPVSETGNDKRTAIAALTHELACRYQQYRSIGPGEVILIDMGAVAASAAGKGIYQEMRKAVQRHARRAGFRFVVAELSSTSTQHVVLKKLGHCAVAEIRFADFEMDGERPFAAISAPKSIVLAEGVL